MKKTLVSMLLTLILVLSLGLAACDLNVDNSPAVYTVKFMSGSSVVDTKEVESGQKVSAPLSEPTKNGYDFDGWFENLKVDGTGMDSAFDFDTPITKNLTLHAAFTEEVPKPADEISLTVFIRDNYGVAYGAAITESGELSLSGYDREAYKYGGFSIELLEEYAGSFDMPDELAYLDIRDIAVIMEEHKYFTQYIYTEDVYSYQLVTYAEGEQFSVFYFDADYENGEYCYLYSADYYIFGDTSYISISIYVEENGEIIESSEYRIIEVDGVRTVYQPSDTEDLDDALIIDEDFINEYACQGVVYIRARDREVKDEYIEMLIALGMYSDNLAVQSGGTADLSVYEIEGETAVYEYTEYTLLDKEIPFKGVFSAESIAAIKEYIADGMTGEFSFLSIADVPLNFTSDFSGVFDTDAEYFTVVFVIADANDITDGYLHYIIIVEDGQLASIQMYSTSDGISSDYTLYLAGLDKASGEYTLYTFETVEFTGVLSAEQFEIYKKLQANGETMAQYVQITKVVQ